MIILPLLTGRCTNSGLNILFTLCSVFTAAMLRCLNIVHVILFDINKSTYPFSIRIPRSLWNIFFCFCLPIVFLFCFHLNFVSCSNWGSNHVNQLVYVLTSWLLCFLSEIPLILRLKSVSIMQTIKWMKKMRFQPCDQRLCSWSVCKRDNLKRLLFSLLLNMNQNIKIEDH